MPDLTGESHAEGACHAFAPRVDVDELDLAPGYASGQPGDQATNRAAADDRDPIPDLGPGIPQAVDGRLDIRGQHGAMRRYGLG